MLIDRSGLAGAIPPAPGSLNRVSLLEYLEVVVRRICLVGALLATSSLVGAVALWPAVSPAATQGKKVSKTRR